MRGLMAAIGLIAIVTTSTAGAAEPARIYAAGSLSGVLPELLKASGLEAEAFGSPVYGPAGQLSQRLLRQERADLFLSADLAAPHRVVAAKGGLVIPFVRNRMCVVAPRKLGLTSETLLDRMLAPDFRLATSTPVVDPGGDYAWAVFDRAEALHPGAKATLSAKAQTLLGSPASMKPQPGHSPQATIFLENRADAILYYCSGATATAKELPDLEVTPVPASLNVDPVYGFAILSDRPDVARLALFILSEQGQAILTRRGFQPLAEPADAGRGESDATPNQGGAASARRR